ncbi:MAG: zinc-binding dehydrogenase, partial [Candidatus Latescibacteria bacterium]|nr:zinc-binding dehydrogenase [Candidatus Latescibacterota bacterium]
KQTGYSRNAHAEYYRLGIQGIHPVPDNAEWPEAAILTGDGLGVPIRASRRLGDTSGKKVVVLGLGPVGLSNVLVQSFKGANVMAADLISYRIEHAKTLGATNAFHIRDLKPAVMDWTEGSGADIVIIAVGHNDALNQAIDLVKYRGTIFQVGEISQATINPSAVFIRKEVTWTGSWYYTSADWEDMLGLYQAGLPIDKLITHTYPFEKAQEAYDTFVSGESGKVVLTYP